MAEKGNEVQAHKKHAGTEAKHGEFHAAQQLYNTPAGFSVRGAVLEGVVISARAPKTVTIERFITRYIPKFERYKKIRSKVKAHLPDGIVVREGDTILVGETRKLSKTKSFVVLSVVKRGEA